jgi:hypothetical protein
MEIQLNQNRCYFGGFLFWTGEHYREAFEGQGKHRIVAHLDGSHEYKLLLPDRALLGPNQPVPVAPIPLRLPY